MQIGAGLRRSSIPARAVHPVDLLDASYAALQRDAGRGAREAGRGTRDA